MSEVRISAEPRTEFGKGAARRVRRSGNIPAVLYGHGTAPRHISLPGHDFERALHTEAGANVLLSIDIEGGSELALPKAIQRDPVNLGIDHVDLILVRRGEKITVEVPVHLSGDVAIGGLVDHQLTTVSVLAEATHIPSALEVSIAGLEIGGSVHAKEVALPSGVELHTDGDAVVVHILAAPTAEEMEAELDITAPEEPAAEEAAAAGEAAEGEPAEAGAEASETASADAE